MGKVQAGGRKEVAFSVTNPSDIPVAVARIETSCRCLKIELPTNVLAPGQTLAGRARIDLATEAGFVGGLGIEVKGLGESGAVLFAVDVDVEVQRG
jgi:hypothetical protein